MAQVIIRGGEISARTAMDVVPREQWKELWNKRRLHLNIHLEADCRDLLIFVREAEEFEVWEEFGYKDKEDFIRDMLSLDPSLVGWALEGLEVMDPDKAAPFRKAVDEGIKAEAQKARKEGKAPKTGDIGRNRRDNITPNDNDRGTSVNYTLRRLLRDREDLFERVEAGELSPNAAAIQAGFRPVSVSFSARTQPEDAVRKIREKLGDDYWRRMKEAT